MTTVPCNKATARRCLEAVADHPSGVAVRFSTEGKAVRFRQLVNQVAQEDPKHRYASVEIEEGEGYWQVNILGEMPLPLFDPKTGEPLT